MSDTTAPRTYGHWTRPRIQGIFGLGALQTAMLFVAAIATIIAVVVAGLKGALVVMALTALLSVPLLKQPRTGRTMYQSAALRLRGRMLRKSGKSVLVQGPAGMVPDGKYRLPGLLAATELFEAKDAYGVPFGVLKVPSAGTYSVVIEGTATGTDMVDPSVVDQQVARWGYWLASLGQENTDIIGAQVSIETSPDPGVRLRRAIEARRSASSPSFATKVMDEVKETYPAGQSSTSTLISVTFKSRNLDGAKKAASTEEMVTRISNVLPSIVAGLRSTGAGQAPMPMSAQDIVDYARAAWDPSVAQLVEEARDLEGGTGLSWNEVGPQFFDDRNPHVLVHDRAYSMSWQMLGAPRSVVQSTVLTQLLAPHPDIARKRVTLLYRPLSMEQSANVAEAEVRNAEFVINNSKRIESRQAARLRHARRTADEEAEGAGLVRFGMVVTASVLDPANLPKARQTVRNLSASARLQMREATHVQASTFTAGLPLGLVLPSQVLLTPEIMDAV